MKEVNMIRKFIEMASLLIFGLYSNNYGTHNYFYTLGRALSPFQQSINFSPNIIFMVCLFTIAKAG